MNKRKPTIETIPIIDLGLNCSEINALKTALDSILRAVGGGGYKNHVRSRQPRLKRNSQAYLS